MEAPTEPQVQSKKHQREQKMTLPDKGKGLKPGFMKKLLLYVSPQQLLIFKLISTAVESLRSDNIMIYDIHADGLPTFLNLIATSADICKPKESISALGFKDRTSGCVTATSSFHSSSSHLQVTASNNLVWPLSNHVTFWDPEQRS